MVLKLEITDGEDGPSALLRVDLSVGDSQITFGTGTETVTRSGPLISASTGTRPSLKEMVDSVSPSAAR